MKKQDRKGTEKELTKEDDIDLIAPSGYARFNGFQPIYSGVPVLRTGAPDDLFTELNEKGSAYWIQRRVHIHEDPPRAGPLIDLPANLFPCQRMPFLD